jgi:hypothetical protein
VALGWDGGMMMADALKAAGPKADDIVAYFNKVKDWPGHLRHRHLDAGAAQRLPRLGSGDVRGQLAEGRCLQPAPGYSA